MKNENKRKKLKQNEKKKQKVAKYSYTHILCVCLSFFQTRAMFSRAEKKEDANISFCFVETILNGKSNEKKTKTKILKDFHNQVIKCNPDLL